MNEPAKCYAGVDWGSESHCVWLTDGDGRRLADRSFKHGGEGLADMIAWLLKTGNANRPSEIHVAIEVPHGPVVETLLERGFTLATAESKFGYTEVRIGFIPAIVSTFLVRQVGEKQARDLLLTGRIIGAEEALHLGLASEVVAAEKVLPRARELAAALLQNSPASLLATKRLLTRLSTEELDRQIAGAVEENASIRATADFREGVTSFLEKRKPQWSGR